MMKVSKTMFIVLLTVFCLAIMVVSAIPSLSSVGGYDPQYDVNHDGTIDMRDLGAVARDFSPTSTGNDPTLQANVTNWPWTQPEPTVVWCGDYQIISNPQWPHNTAIVGINVPFLYNKVGDYGLMTVRLSFSNVQWQHGCSYISAYASWATSMFGADPVIDYLTSTLYQINPPGGNTGVISTDFYSINAPYLQVVPYFAAASHDSILMGGNYGNATFSVYVYLSNQGAVGSLHKTMSWGDLESEGTYMYDFGTFNLRGFSQLTMYLSSNVTWSVNIQKGLEHSGMYTFDTFSFSNLISKTYSIDSELYDITVSSPSMTPWDLSGSFFVVS